MVQPPCLFPPSHDQPRNSSGSNGDDATIFDTRFNIGVVAGIGGAIIASLLNISVRYLKDTSPNVLIFYGGLGGLLDVLVMFKFDDKSTMLYGPWQESSVLHIAIVSIIGIVAYLLTVKCYQMIRPALASILKSQEIIFAFILQSLALEVIPSMYSIGGAILVVSSAIFIPMEDFLVQNVAPNCIRNLL